MTSQSDALPTIMDEIKAKPLSSYLDRDITERLNLSEPIEPNQSGSSNANLLGEAAGTQVTTSEEQSSALSKKQTRKRLIIEDDEEEERGNHEQSKILPESLIEEETKESETTNKKIVPNS